MEKQQFIFAACRNHRHCDECPGAYFIDSETRAVCSCSHHHQGELLTEHKIVSKQQSLF